MQIIVACVKVRKKWYVIRPAKAATEAKYAAQGQ